MAFPVVLNGRTYTLADFEGTNYVDGLPDAFEDFVTHAGDIYNDTSTSSATVGTGSKTFTVSSGKPYQAGTPLRIADAAAPETNFLDCIVTSYSGTSLVVNAFGFAGSGTKTSWTINIGGAKTADGTLAISQGGTGATTAAAARTALDTYSKSEADSRFLNVSGEASDVTMSGNVTIGDADTDTLTINAATTATADISFGDNDKAIFGAGSDLQIYHDGGNSLIEDAGIGSLIIEGTNLNLRANDNSRYLVGTDGSGGSTALYHPDGDSLKLATTSAGIDVTGTVTADGLTLDGQVSQSGTAPAYTIVQTDTTDLNTRFQVNGQSLLFSTINDALTTTTSRLKINNSSGDISFYNSAGTSQDLYWDASTSRLGLGTTSPEYRLEIEDTSDVYTQINATGADTTSGLVLKNDARSWVIRNEGGDSDKFQIRDATANAQRLTIDSSGQVGIGTSSPQATIQTKNTSNSATLASVSNSFSFSHQSGSYTEGHYYGVLGFAKANSNGATLGAAIAPVMVADGNTRALAFGIASGGGSVTERFRLDDSGNLLVGTTSTFGKLSINSNGAPASSGNMTTGLTVHNSTGGTAINIGTNDAGAYNYIQSAYVNSAGTARNLAFFAGATRAVDIDTSGNLLVGTTSASLHNDTSGSGFSTNATSGFITAARAGLNASVICNKTSQTTAQATDYVEFRNQGTAVGEITYDGTDVSIAQVSDARLKTNVVDAVGSGEIIDAVQVRSFDWVDGARQSKRFGFVAQELHSAFPEAVKEGGESPEENPWTINEAKLIPVLLKEIQSLRARVAQLEGAN